MIESAKRKRRWFQFSLRTLMIVVTLLAVPLGYVGWQSKIVRNRNAWKSNRPAADPPYSTYAATFVVLRGDPDQKPNRMRRWLGDEANETIALPTTATDEDIRKAIVLFPEAEVIFYLKKPSWP
jgi:hypothetical protein